jgi:peptidoglycan hydrolase-like protein with peptidoglycan-binding domain
MKHLLLATALLFAFTAPVLAQEMDIIGGPDSNTQTIHHCGLLPTDGKRYTTSAVTTGIVESKLAGLGYKNVTTDGYYGYRDIAAVKQFQRDHGLQVDGIVGPITARHLAYEGHPSATVRRCHRTVDMIR